MEIQKTKDYYAPLLPGRFYHVYNRTNNKEKLFRNDENRYFFLQRYQEFLGPYLKTYAYCLLPNHFHFLVSIRSVDEIELLLSNLSSSNLTIVQKSLYDKGLNEEGVSVIIQHQFRRFFISYSKAYNKMWSRAGNFLNRRFKRLEVEDEIHFTNLIYYIHANPVLHGIRKFFSNYKWNSYQSILSKQPTKLERIEVLNWFGGKSEFIEYHNQFHADYVKNRFEIEAKMENQFNTSTASQTCHVSKT